MIKPFHVYFNALFSDRDRLSSFVFYFQTFFRKDESLYKIKDKVFSIRKNTSDILVVNEIFKTEIYPIRPEGVVFDVGANIGTFAVFAAKTADKVYSFEPEQSNFEQLCKNVELNNAKEKVFPQKIAIGDISGDVKIYKGKFNKSSTSVEKKITEDFEVVKMKTLPEIFKELNLEKIDLLKVDIEGSEYGLFEKIPEEIFKKIDAVIVEYHYVPGRSYEQLKSILEKNGFKVKNNKGLPYFFIGLGILIATK